MPNAAVLRAAGGGWMHCTLCWVCCTWAFTEKQVRGDEKKQRHHSEYGWQLLCQPHLRFIYWGAGRRPRVRCFTNYRCLVLVSYLLALSQGQPPGEMWLGSSPKWWRCCAGQCSQGAAGNQPKLSQARERELIQGSPCTGIWEVAEQKDLSCSGTAGKERAGLSECVLVWCYGVFFPHWNFLYSHLCFHKIAATF